MTLQNQFDFTINLLKANETKYPIIKTLLENYQREELAFSSFDNPSPGTSKDILLKIYEHRSNYGGDHVIGYDTLMPIFRKTEHAHICISDFTTLRGSYIVFSDFSRSDILGVLFSKTNLDEVKAKGVTLDLFVSGKLIQEQIS